MPHQRSDLLDFLGDECARRPRRLCVTDPEPAAPEDVLPPQRVRHFGVELHAIHRPAFMAERCITTAAAPAHGEVARGELEDLVAVAHPDLRFLMNLEALEETLRLFDFEHCPAVF